jgi:putative endonuclease
MPQYYVYVLASRRYGTLYTGITSDLPDRVFQHKNGLLSGFTSRYGVHNLVWFEMHGDVNDAIAREKQIKGWNRAWKIRLIEKGNPN